MSNEEIEHFEQQSCHKPSTWGCCYTRTTHEDGDDLGVVYKAYGIGFTTFTVTIQKLDWTIQKWDQTNKQLG